MDYLSSCPLQTTRDDFRRIRAAADETLLQCLDRRRQDKGGNHLGENLFHLERALPVNFQHDVVSGGEFLLNPKTAGAIVISMDESPFEELVVLLSLFKILLRDEVIVHSILFSGANLAGCVGN